MFSFPPLQCAVVKSAEPAKVKSVFSIVPKVVMPLGYQRTTHLARQPDYFPASHRFSNRFSPVAFFSLLGGLVFIPRWTYPSSPRGVHWGNTLSAPDTTWGAEILFALWADLRTRPAKIFPFFLWIAIAPWANEVAGLSR
jgi:hypothetical protein